MNTDLYPSKNKVKQVGSILASAEPDEATRVEAIRIMGLWRSAHEPALHAIFRKMRDIPNQYRGAIVAARLKRLATIEGKLRRPGTTFQLNTMYDIAGCRCILPSVDDLRTVQSRIESEESIRKSHDYLTYPKTSGYRGSHLIVDVALPNSPYGKLPVEIQLRTKLQHLWSTAVETFDICQKQGVKFDQAQSSAAARAFALVSNLFARREGLPLPAETPQDKRDTIEELKTIDQRINLFDQLRAYANSVSIVAKEPDGATTAPAACYLLSMMYADAFGIAEGFTSVEAALRRYTELEQRNQADDDAVLVITSSERDINCAFPNYTSNISEFLDLLSSYLRA